MIPSRSANTPKNAHLSRSEVVGRPLAALLANDGARVFSVDIDSIQEYTKRPVSSDATTAAARSYHPHHVARPSQLNLAQCLALSDVVVSAVPNSAYKVRTEWLKDGCICVNVAAEKNFEANVREKVRAADKYERVLQTDVTCRLLSIFPQLGR
jgi:methylenetetrahydrofolate dehydrogenase (NAD+)